MIGKLLNIGISENLNYFQRTTIRLINGVAISSILTTFIAETYILLTVGVVPSGLTIALCSIFFGFVYIFLNYKGKHKISRGLLVVNANITLVSVLFLVDPSLRADDMFLVLIPLYIGMFKSLKTVLRIVFVTFSIYLLGIYVTSIYDFDYPMTFSDESKVIVRMTFLCLTIALMFLTTIFFKRGTEKSRQEIEEKNTDLSYLLEENKQQLIELKKGLAEKQFLLSEVHHRVNNNLQILASILHLQQDDLEHGNTDANIVLSELLSRINSLSLIHRQIYEDDEFTGIRLAQLLGGLIFNLSEIYPDAPNIRIENTEKEIIIPTEISSPFTLLINEVLNYIILTSTLIPNASNQEISVSLDAKENFLTVNCELTQVSNVNLSKESLSPQLINLLTKQLKGTYIINNYNSLTITLTVPV